MSNDFNNIKNICVYGSSSNAIDNVFKDEAYMLGAAIASSNRGLVYGAGDMGVMGASARGAHSEGGKVIGVIPKFMHIDGIAYKKCDELILTNTMRERKQKMEDLADAFIAAAGGIGTFEEFFEIITLKQLGQHQKAIVLLNTNGYYSNLNDMMERCVLSKFAKPATLDLYHVAGTIAEAMSYIKSYVYTKPEQKWF